MLLVLITLSLACSMTAYRDPAGSIPTLTNAGDVGDVATSTTWRTCARVISDGALHLRAEPGMSARVLAYLRPDHVVGVLDQLDSMWWRVDDGTLVGYARSIYLEEVSCDERNLINGKK